jgi:hypothetical protein
MKIQSITTGFDQQVGLILFGLGNDNKVYRWDAVIGGWQPNWNTQPAVDRAKSHGQGKA